MSNEITARMPWLYAEGGSYWAITGAVSERHTVTNCVARVVPDHVTGVNEGHAPALFEVPVVGGSVVHISADRVTRATRLILVLADEPGTAYYLDDQDFIDADRGLA